MRKSTFKSDHLPPIREFADRGVQWLLSRPENLRGLLMMLAPELAEAVDYAGSRTVNTTFTRVSDVGRLTSASLR
jgi:hypothetical protein